MHAQQVRGQLEAHVQKDLVSVVRGDVLPVQRHQYQLQKRQVDKPLEHEVAAAS